MSLYLNTLPNSNKVEIDDFKYLENRFNQLLSEVDERFNQMNEHYDGGLVEIVSLTKRKFEQYRDRLSFLKSSNLSPSYLRRCYKLIYKAQFRWIKVLEVYLQN